MMISTDLHFVDVVYFYALLAAFWWPGVRAVQLSDREGRLGFGARIALGFPIAFGVFSAVTGPLLLTHCPSNWARTVGFVTWTIAVIGLEFALYRVRQRRPAQRESVFSTDPTTQIAAEPTRELPHSIPAPSWWLVAAGMLILTAVDAWAFTTGVVSRRLCMVVAVLLFFANALVVWRAKCALRPASEPAKRTRIFVSRVAAVGVAILIALQLVATTIYVREDADDTLYLSEALLLQDTDAMGKEAPTHRGEALPSNVVYAWQAFELWGAQLSRLSGIHPMVAFRTSLAPVLVVITLLLLAELFRRFLPPWAIPIGMLVALAYFTFGISSHWTANNYLLTRSAQGKTWLIHTILPAMIILTEGFLRRPRSGTWALLLATSFGALGMAPASVFLVPALLAPLLAVTCVIRPGRRTLLRASAAGIAVLPQLAFGAYLFANESSILKDLTLSWGTDTRWRDDFFFKHLNFHSGGALEVFVLLAVPYLALLLKKKDQWIYPLAFTIVFMASMGNPLLHLLVAGHLTGAEGYQRLFWLVPFHLLLGGLAVGCVAIAAQTTAPRLAGLGVLALALVVQPLLGGHCVWSPANDYSAREKAARQIYRASNPYKMPANLLAVANQLATQRNGPEARILCSERTASHLSPFKREFDFVYTRNYQTYAPLLVLGRETEADERKRLAREFLAGEVERDEALPLLAKSHVAHVVLDEPNPKVEPILMAAGFELRAQTGSYRLFTRPTDKMPGQLGMNSF